MHAFRPIIILLLTISAAFADDVPSSASVTTSQQRSYEVTTSVRTNGCKVELWRYVKDRPEQKGYWIQHLYAGNKHLLQIEHSATEKEQVLMIAQDTGYGVLQVDRNLDGKYGMLIVVSLKDQRLIDVLLTTDDGWLRHSTPEEFQARQRIGEKIEAD